MNFFSSKTYSTLPNCLRRPYHPHPSLLINFISKTTRSKIWNHATQIHAYLITSGFVSSPIVFTNLLNLYFECGVVDHSVRLFSTAQSAYKNTFTWTSLISRLTRFRDSVGALIFFNQMRSTNARPNEYTYSAVLRACGGVVHVIGEQVHCLILKSGFGADCFVGTGLVDAYAKSGDIFLAEKVFDEMCNRNQVSWNALLVGYLHCAFYNKTLWLFKEILKQGLENVELDEISFSSVLSACASIRDLSYGRQVHGLIIKHGLLHSTYVSTSLMDAYFKNGFVSDAVAMFKIVGGISCLVSCNVVLDGLCVNKEFEEAVKFFCFLRREGCSPDEATVCFALNATGSLGTITLGKLIHIMGIKMGFQCDVFVSASLITMYAASGSLLKAYQVFEETKFRNLICWNAMIVSWQQHGFSRQAIDEFEKMLKMGIKPSYASYAAVIAACGSVNCIEEGIRYFNSMKEVYDMAPGGHQVASMIELLGRNGLWKEGTEYAETMESEVWRSLLRVCWYCGNVRVGEKIGRRLFELEPNNHENYVLLAELYARNGMTKEAGEVRRCIQKEAADCCWIQVGNSTTLFAPRGGCQPGWHKIETSISH